MKKLLTALAIASALSLSSCKSTGTETSTDSDAMIMNTSCPISSKPIDANVTADYMGKKVGFCCKNCLSKWEAMSAEEKAAKVK